MLIFVCDYVKIMREFKFIIRLCFLKLKVKIYLDVFKDFIRIFEVKKFLEIEIELYLILLFDIDFVNVCMELIVELNGLEGKVMGGCFIENGDIVLVYYSFNWLLYFNNLKLKWKINLKWILIDVVC